MLMQLSSFPQVPRPHSVVQATSPQFRAIRTNVYARGAVSVPLKLTHKRLILQIPDGNVAVRAARETDLGVWRDCEGVASGSV